MSWPVPASLGGETKGPPPPPRGRFFLSPPSRESHPRLLPLVQTFFLSSLIHLASPFSTCTRLAHSSFFSTPSLFSPLTQTTTIRSNTTRLAFYAPLVLGTWGMPSIRRLPRLIATSTLNAWCHHGSAKCEFSPRLGGRNFPLFALVSLAPLFPPIRSPHRPLIPHFTQPANLTSHTSPGSQPLPTAAACTLRTLSFDADTFFRFSL